MFRAVLFDFAFTLFGPDPDGWIRTAAASVGRTVTPADADRIATSFTSLLRETALNPAHARRDLDPAISEQLIMPLLTHIEGVDLPFARALTRGHIETMVPYPDTPEVLRELHSRGIRVGVVSNVVTDLRPLFARHGLAEYVTSFTLSFEVGAVKPDPRIWSAALATLDATPETTLMVGDHPAGDGGAATAGITVLIVPLVPGTRTPRGLSTVLPLVQPLSAVPLAGEFDASDRV
jgi:HAD superfamily hydrolase (TIGR01509 family)